MSLLPRWYNRLPSLLRKESEGVGKWLGDFDFPGFSPTTGLTVSSDDKYYYVEADVPGLTGDEVDVEIDPEGMLLIQGERKEEGHDIEKKYFQRAEFRYSYCVPLNPEIDLSIDPQATCTNGIMKIVFTKKKGDFPKAKKIKVKKS